MPAKLATDPPPVISSPNPDAAPVRGIAEVNDRGLRVASRPGVKKALPMAFGWPLVLVGPSEVPHVMRCRRTRRRKGGER